MLNDALSSVLKQEGVDLKIVVCDNASTDETAKTVENFASDKRIAYIRNPHNIGMIPNISNAVSNHVKTKYFAVLSDDDYYVDNSYLSKAVEFLENNNGVSFAHGEVEFDCHNEKSIKKNNRMVPEILPGREFFLRFGACGHGFVYLLTSVVRTDLIKKIGFFNEAGIFHGDSLAWLRLSLLGDVKFFPSVVGRYRWHSNNTIKNDAVDQWLQDIEFVEIAYREAASSGLFSAGELKKWLIRQRRFYVSIAIGNIRCISRVKLFDVINRLHEVHRAFFDWYLILKFARCSPKFLFPKD